MLYKLDELSLEAELDDAGASADDELDSEEELLSDNWLEFASLDEMDEDELETTSEEEDDDETASELALELEITELDEETASLDDAEEIELELLKTISEELLEKTLSEEAEETEEDEPPQTPLVLPQSPFEIFTQ